MVRVLQVDLAVIHLSIGLGVFAVARTVELGTLILTTLTTSLQLLDLFTQPVALGMYSLSFEMYCGSLSA